ncbi:DUF6402 family protein [Ralstonia sp. 25C]|uniref:DUF6402 family protein n=1 Tax=Ralstonia sp. 25C TaxID=3447363 RepID=UPI003F75023F
MNSYEFSFLEKGLIRPLWQMSGETCTAIDANEFDLSMEKSPPKLSYQEPPPPKPQQAPKPFRGLSVELREWLLTRPPAPPPPQPKPVAPVVVRKPRVAPFDLQDIPDAMDRIGWPVSAKLQRRWFAGALNYANTDDGARDGINQNGKPFPPSMIDTTTIKLDWLFRFPRAKEAFDYLSRKDVLFTPHSKDALVKKFRKFKPSGQCLSTWKLCNENMHEYHKNFQFQLVHVDSDFYSKLKMFMRGTAAPNGIWMDDLYGALGAFTFDAAIDSYSYMVYSNGLARLEIYGLSIYARDVFTFHDRSDEWGTQYLGHWNKTGFIIIPAATIAGEVTKSDIPWYTVARNGLITEKNVYYPVRNKDYRNWQLQHGQGGDFIIYSDRRRVPLADPIVVEFYLE